MQSVYRAVLSWTDEHLTSNSAKLRAVLMTGASAGALLMIWRRWSWNRRYRLPAGPTPLPLLGNILNVGPLDRTFQRRVHELRKTYGDIFTIWLGTSPIVIISSPDLAREAFMHKGAEFGGRPYVWSLDYLSHQGTAIFYGQFTPVWQLQRKLAHAAMRKYATGQAFVDVLYDVFHLVVEELQKNREDEAVDILEVASLVIFNVIGQITMGKKMALDDPVLQNIYTLERNLVKAQGTGMWADIFPLLRHIPTSGVRAMKEFDAAATAVCTEAFEDHMDKFDPDNLRDVTDEVISQWKKAQLEEENSDRAVSQLTRHHFSIIILDIFLAGTGTSTSTLSFIIAYMITYPEVQRKMQKELDDVLGIHDKATLNNRKELAYTEAVVHEVLRLSSSVPFGLPHETRKDTTLGDYSLPKGTTVLLNIYSIHRDPRYFTDPDVFNPDRWLDEHGQFEYQPFSFIPFSLGRRACIGEPIAKVQLHLLTAMLFHKFTFTRADEQTINLEGDLAFPILESPIFKAKIKERI